MTPCILIPHEPPHAESHHRREAGRQTVSDVVMRLVPLLAISDQVIVAITTIVLMTVVVITAVFRYKADDFVKFWAAVGTVIGVALGTVGTYFFTKEKVVQAESRLRTAQVALEISELQRAEAATKIRQLSPTLLPEQHKASDKLNEIQLILSNDRFLGGDSTGTREMWDYLRFYFKQYQSPTPSPAPQSSPRPTATDKTTSPTSSPSPTP